MTNKHCHGDNHHFDQIDGICLLISNASHALILSSYLALTPFIK